MLPVTTGLLLIACLLVACAGPSRSAATPTLPAGPVVLATAIPTALPTATRPTPTPIAPPTLPSTGPPVQTETVRVTNTGGQGLTMRQTPGGAAIRGLPDGTVLSVTGEEQAVGDRLWRKVRDAQGREGWVAAEFLTAEGVGGPSPVTIVAASPTPGPESVALASATPTWPVPLIPTATLRPPPPTRTPRTQESPAPIAAPTAPPVVMPAIVATKPAIVATKPTATGNCDPSYPDFCIPPPPPDLSCDSPVLAGRRRFMVRQPDPHQLDGNKNGVGCE